MVADRPGDGDVPRQARAFVTGLGVLAGAAVVAAAVTWRAPSWSTVLDAVAIAAAWGLTEASPLVVTYRRDSAVLVPVEAVALPALLLLPAPVVVLAAAVGTFLAFGLLQGLPPVAKMRTRSVVKIGFNRAATVVAVAGGAVTTAGMSRLHVGPMVGALVGVFVFWWVSRLAVVALLRLLHGRSPDASGTLARDLGQFGVAAAAGLLLGMGVGDGRLPAWWLVAMMAVVAAGARLLARSTLAQARLQDLMRVADDVQARLGPDEIDASILASACDLLGCEEAVLAESPGGDGTLSEMLPGADPPVWLVVRKRYGLSRGFDDDDASLLRGLTLIAAAARDRGRVVDTLRTADELKSMVLAAVAHDLRTPLSVATAALQTLHRYRDRLSPEREREMMGSLEVALARIEGITGQLVDLKRLEMAAGPRRGAASRMDEVTREVAASLDGSSGAPIQLDLAPTPASISAIVLRHVVGNLLDNARKHAPDGSVVDCRCWCEDDRAVLAVADRGDGVPAEARAAILEPFRQAGPAEIQARGVGLGLYLVDRFVALHDGALAIRDRDGGGTVFEVRLPIPSPAGDDADETDGQRDQQPATQFRSR